MPEAPPRIRGQDSAYRRGLVLGLTMAEIMLLILFMLLLILGAVLQSRQTEIERLKRQNQDGARLEAFIADELKQGHADVTVTDIIQRISRDRAVIALLQQQLANVGPDRQSEATLKSIIQQIHKDGGDASPHAIAEKVKRLDQSTREIANLKGQISQLTNQIRASGKGGNEYPSCWVTPLGKTQSIFEIELSAAGLRVKDRKVAGRGADEAALPLASIQFDEDLVYDAFLSELRPLYLWSVQHGCRFYVLLFSSGSSAPIQGVNAANSYFYPDSRIQYRSRR